MTTILRTQIWPAIAALLVLTVVTGVLYPAAVTLVGQVAFNDRQRLDGRGRWRGIGSALIGQAFDDPAYFWPRPSAAGDGYDGLASSGSNLAPTSAALIERIRRTSSASGRATAMAPIPVDLVTASASGLDPHISVDAAEYQADGWRMRAACARRGASGDRSPHRVPDPRLPR